MPCRESSSWADSAAPCEDATVSDWGHGAEPTEGEAARVIRIIVVDDHVEYRTGMRLLVGFRPDIDVVGEAGDGAEALGLTLATRPDVVLLDLRMPGMGGIEACKAIREAAPQTKVLILTSSDDEADLFEAVRSGANGYILKGAPGDEVAAGIRAVHNGHSLISPSMAAKLLAEFAALSRPAGPPPAPEPDFPKLTGRELAVLKLVARGLGNRDIAKELFISENTVKNHVRNILEKLQMHSRMEATMYAIRQNIITPHD